LLNDRIQDESSCRLTADMSDAARSVEPSWYRKNRQVKVRSNAIAIQSIALDRLATANQLALQSLVSARSASAADAALLDSASSIVQWSALGQVLAAGAALQTSLEAMPSSTLTAAHTSTR